MNKMADTKEHATPVEDKIKNAIIVMLEEFHFNRGVGGMKVRS